MIPLFGTAGLGEAAAAMVYLFLLGLLSVPALLVVFSFFKRLAILAVAAMIALVLLSVIIQPWTAWTVTPHFNDPDEAYWYGTFQNLGMLWSIGFLIAVIEAVWFWLWPKGSFNGSKPRPLP